MIIPPLKGSIIDAELANLLPAYKAALEEMGIPTDHCTPEELIAAINILDEYEAGGFSPTMDRMVEADYYRTPPTIEEFCEDDYWMGGVLKTDEQLNQRGIFPKWRQEIYDAMAPGRQVQQIIATGAIGIGKTFAGATVMLYRFAKLLCMRNPIQYYGLSRISRMVFSCFSVTEDQVKQGVFGDLVGMMGVSPFFNEIMPVGDRKFSDKRIQFPNKLEMRYGSKIYQALGGNVLVSLIDEVNFRIEKEAANAAHQLVTSLERRQESRFKSHQDTLMILLSSAKHQVDFLTQHIHRNRHNPKVVIWDFPLWEVRGGVTIHYSGKQFCVDIGDNVTPASILPIDDFRLKEKDGVQMTEVEKAAVSMVKSMPSSRILWVPEEHRKAFEDDPDAAIRDIAGKVTGRMAKYFSDVMPVINSIIDEPNPFSVETLKLSVDSGHMIHELLAENGRHLLQAQGNIWLPRRHPHAPRYIHIDVATGGVDALGFTMVHPVYMQQIKRTNILTGEERDEMSPIYEMDFSMRITRERPHKPIDFTKIRAFIGWLKNRGFKIKLIGCDLANLSFEMRGLLEKAGYKTVVLSVDRKRDPYDTFKQVVIENRFRMPRNDYLCLELINLVDNIDKIDHPDAFDVQWKKGMIQPKKGSKDMADGLAGAVYLAETDKENVNIPLYATELLVAHSAAEAVAANLERPPAFRVPTF